MPDRAFHPFDKGVKVIQHGIEVTAHGGQFVLAGQSGTQGEIVVAGDSTHHVGQLVEAAHDAATDGKVEQQGGDDANGTQHDHHPGLAIMLGMDVGGQLLEQGGACRGHLLLFLDQACAQAILAGQTQLQFSSNQLLEVLAVALEQLGLFRIGGQRLGQRRCVGFQLIQVACIPAQHEVLLVAAQLQQDDFKAGIVTLLEGRLKRMGSSSELAVEACFRREADPFLLTLQSFEFSLVVIECTTEHGQVRVHLR